MDILPNNTKVRITEEESGFAGCEGKIVDSNTYCRDKPIYEVIIPTNEPSYLGGKPCSMWCTAYSFDIV